MPDYRRMYYTLCAGVLGLLDDMRPDGENESIYHRLEMLLQKAEDIYIETADIIQLAHRADPAQIPHEDSTVRRKMP